MPERKPLLPPGPSEPVFITFPDGTKREIRYTIGSFTRIKATLGVSLIGRNSALATLGEDSVPAIILEGLKTADPQCDLTLAQIAELPAGYLPYFLRSFMLAFAAALPDPEKNEPDQLAPPTAQSLM